MKLTFILITSLVLGSVYAASAQAAESMMLRVEKSRDSETLEDPEVTTLGAFSITAGKVAHFDLIQFDSQVEGEVKGFDFGLGYTYSEGRGSPIVVYLGFGLTLAYNKDQSDFVPGYYPQAGIVYMLKQGVGITATAKRYFNIYDDSKDVVSFGLLLKY